MASEEGLKILLKAEVQDFLKDMKAATEAILAIAGAIASAVKPLDDLSSAAGKSGKAADDLADEVKNQGREAKHGSASNDELGDAVDNVGKKTKKTTKSIADGGTALTSFGRIVQDAPFGIIAIGNNITQFAEQFGYLSVKTGSASSALKAIGSSILGAGGITLGISLITSGITVLVQKYGSLANAIVALNPFISNQIKLISELNATMVKNASSTYEEISNIDLMLKSVKDVNVSLEERKRITNELIKQYPETFQGLTMEAIAAGKADMAYKKLTNTLLAQAAVKAGTDLIGERGKALLQLRINAAKLEAELNDLRDTSNDSFFGSLADRDKQIAAVQNKINANKREQNKIGRETEFIQQEQIKLVEQFGAKVLGLKGPGDVVQIFKQLNIELSQVDERAKLTGESAKKVAQTKLPLLSKVFDQIADIGGKKAQPILKEIGNQINILQALIDTPKGKHIKTVAEVLKELQASLDATDAQAKLFGGTTDNLAQEKLQALNKAFDDLVKLGLKPTSPELKKVADQINFLSASIIGVKPLTTILSQPLGKAVKTTRVKPLTPEELGKILGVSSESKLFLEPKVKVEPIYQTTPALENLGKFSSQFVAKMQKLGAEGKRAFEKTFIVWGDALTSGLTPAIVDLGATLQQGLSNTFSSLGEGLGKAFAGGGLAEVLNGIVNSMSDFIITFGKQLVEAGTLALIAQKSLIANPYLAIAAGIGAIAIGTALKNKVPAFATGGAVNGPTLAMVGDNPSGVEYMIPKEVLDKVSGGNNGFIAETRLSGSDILVVVKRAGLNQTRING